MWVVKKWGTPFHLMDSQPSFCRVEIVVHWGIPHFETILYIPMIAGYIISPVFMLESESDMLVHSDHITLLVKSYIPSHPHHYTNMQNIYIYI